MRLGSPRIWTAVTGVGCVSLLVCQLADVVPGAVMSKIVASSGFLAVAVAAGASRSRYGRVLFVGLLLSACGDLLLLGPTQQSFLLGLASFLLAHLAYVGAFAIRGIDHRWSLSAAFPIAIVALGVSVWLTPHIAGQLMLPVRAYTLVISLMVVAAFGARGAGGPLLIPLGAVMFYVSDLSVAAGRFVNPEFPHYVWGLPLYYAGQACLALSVAAAHTQKSGKHPA